MKTPASSPLSQESKETNTRWFSDQPPSRPDCIAGVAQPTQNGLRKTRLKADRGKDREMDEDIKSGLRFWLIPARQNCQPFFVLHFFLATSYNFLQLFGFRFLCAPTSAPGWRWCFPCVCSHCDWNRSHLYAHHLPVGSFAVCFCAIEAQSALIDPNKLFFVCLLLLCSVGNRCIQMLHA